MRSFFLTLGLEKWIMTHVGELEVISSIENDYVIQIIV